MGETNVQGEDQKKLDIIANELFINMLKSSFEVCMLMCMEVILTIMIAVRLESWCLKRMRSALKYQQQRGASMWSLLTL